MDARRATSHTDAHTVSGLAERPQSLRVAVHSPRAAVHTENFQRMATVELQLVMQHCDAQSLLALARCSRFTFAAASNSFAWRCAPPVRVDIARFAATEVPMSTLHCILDSMCCSACLPQPQPPLPLPSDAADSRWSLLRHVDQSVHWTSARGVRSGDRYQAFVARRLLPLLPRVRSLDLSEAQMLGLQWSDVHSCLVALGQLTAIDLAGMLLSDDEMRALAGNLPRLRTLRCRPSGDVRQCLQPLTQLPLLTDLGLMAVTLHGSPDDFAVIAECPNLRRLALVNVSEAVCGPLLQAPGLQRLRRLTLALMFCLPDQPRADWTAAFANLQSLRRLTIDRCNSMCAAPLVAAAAEAGCPQLCRLRIAPAILHRSNSWTAALNPRSFGTLADKISVLLERRPEVRVELRVGFSKADVSASWLLPLRAECDWQSAVPQWTDFEVLRPWRHRRRRWPLIFADDELGRESPPEED